MTLALDWETLDMLAGGNVHEEVTAFAAAEHSRYLEAKAEATADWNRENPARRREINREAQRRRRARKKAESLAHARPAVATSGVVAKADADAVRAKIGRVA